jgi:hypothetical protein
MTAPEAIPWLLVSASVLIWRLVKGWRSYAHLFMFALPWPSLLILGHGLADRPMAEVVLRSLGGTALLAIGYWLFFEKEEKPRDEGEREADRPLPYRTTMTRIATYLLFGLFVLQVPLVLLLVNGHDAGALFLSLYMSYVAVSLAILGLAVFGIKRGAPKLAE